MRIDWVPFSASALVLGATALSVGSLLMPSSDDSGDSLRIVQEQGGQGTAVAGLYFSAAVALTDEVDPALFDEVTRDPGLGIFHYGWIGAFYLGELLLGIALLMAKTTPARVPVLLLVHDALVPVTSLLPDSVRPMTALLITVALSGVGISANQRNSSVLTRPGHQHGDASGEIAHAVDRHAFRNAVTSHSGEQ